MEQEIFFELPIKEEISRIIDNLKKDIEEEFNRTTNTWLACLRDNIMAIECYLALARSEKELGADLLNVLGNRLEKLKERVFELEEEYPDKEPQPSDEIKEELIKLFNIFE